MASTAPPARDRIVIRDLIERHAVERPDRLFASFADGTEWSFGALRERVAARAAGLQALGVGQGDMVLSWQGNGPEAVLAFLALNYLGAVYVPINIAYRGQVLEHVIARSGATLMLADHRLAERLAGIATAKLATVVTIGGSPEALSLSGLTVLPPTVLDGAGEPTPPSRPIEPWDTYQVIYTSGTTGLSKGVICTYLQGHAFVRQLRHVGPEDCNLLSLPMFHVGGTNGVYGALIHGGRFAMIEGFQTSSFWDIVRRYGVTTTGLLGVMLQYLLRQPPGPQDRDHTLKTALLAPLDTNAVRFAERFGVDLYAIYNMTELSVVLLWGPTPTVMGARPRAGLEARVVDPHDFEVPLGEPGELVLRSERPWEISPGYLNDPEATAATWRNGWFHTGDGVPPATRTATFSSSTGSRMRYAATRGENISSFEVESAIAAHPDIREAAVVAAKSELSEDEVLAVVAAAPGRTIDPAGLIQFLTDRLAHFMIPRYVRVVEDIPKTPTQKVLKEQLRHDGVTADTWDREKAGIVLKRERLGA
jgi:crotonobetaine/carnitine-CoA ligase